MNRNKSLGKKTISGMIWSFIDLLSGQGIQFITLLLLARLLSPENFGLISMITILISLSNAIIDGGFSQALIREKEVSKEDYSTVFFFNLFLSVSLYGILYSTAGKISDFFGEPQLEQIIPVFSLVIIISSFGVIQKVMLTRNLNFKSLTKINLVAGIISGGVAVICALKGLGVWSIVIRTMLLQLLQVLLFWKLNKWKPYFTFNFHSVKRLFSFGSKLMISTIIDTIYNNLFFVIIGRFYSPAMLGYYTNASNLSNTVSISITTTIQRVSYPALSNIQDNNEVLKNSFRKVLRTTSFIIFPIMIGLAVVAHPLIELLYGKKWLPAVNYFQLLCLASMLYPIHALYLNILQVKGRSDLFLFLEIIKKVLLTVMVVLVMWLKLGILGLVGGLVVSSYLSLFINAYNPSKLISYTFKEQLRDIFPIFISAVSMGCIVYGSSHFMPNNIFVSLILQVMLGSIVYILLSLVLKIREFHTVLDIITSLLKKVRKAQITSE